MAALTVSSKSSQQVHESISIFSKFDGTRDMAGYSIGDRVEVRWQATSFAAKVIHVHSPSTVDVVYDIDGSVGICLTPNEHGLKLLGAEEKVCSVGSCFKNAFRRGLCESHRRKPCTVDGCTTKAAARGVCSKHGALGECLREGCTTRAARKGGRFCIKHGAFGYCTTDACISSAITTRGKCKKHDSKTVACAVEGCSGSAKVRGLCPKHGNVTCSSEGCSSIAQGRGVCNKHGAKGLCSFNNCTSVVYAWGRCWKHGGANKKVCKEEGCTTHAVARGVCAKHGARGTCKFEGCTTNARYRGLPYCKIHGGGTEKLCSVLGCPTASARKGLCRQHGSGKRGVHGWAIGDEVVGYYRGERTIKHPGVIAKRNANGSYKIQFDDGDVDTAVKNEHIFVKGCADRPPAATAAFRGGVPGASVAAPTGVAAASKKGGPAGGAKIGRPLSRILAATKQHTADANQSSVAGASRAVGGGGGGGGGGAAVTAPKASIRRFLHPAVDKIDGWRKNYDDDGYGVEEFRTHWTAESGNPQTEWRTKKEIQDDYEKSAGSDVLEMMWRVLQANRADEMDY